ncbi:MAG TPA: ABC transporter ATP-binding protein [Candidatus Saccharibacteria bacterium]|mgnify:CR=1 FL=1|nr:ABC transporter ATP-binding protein [Candidatus Saccharibacteria bacterium]
MIEVKNITKTYGKKQNAFTALDNVSLSIPQGTSVAILGKSGSGKSTLMHAMSGLDRPEKGEVIVDGENILKLKQKAVDRFRAQKIGFIFQSFFVQGNESVYDNVSLPLEIAGVSRSKRKTRVEAALAAVELSDKIKNKAKNLSGGQKQRLAIARAIANEPAIIFADEPTGNLDSVTGEKVEQLLFGYNKEKGVTLIIVTHDADLAAKCDMVVNIKDGKIESIQQESRTVTAKAVRRPSRKVQ